MNVTTLIGVLTLAILQHRRTQLKLPLKVVTVIVVHFDVFFTTDSCQNIFTWQRVISSKLWIVAVNLKATCIFLYLVLIAAFTLAAAVTSAKAAIAHVITFNIFHRRNSGISVTVVFVHALVITLFGVCILGKCVFI